MYKKALIYLCSFIPVLGVTITFIGNGYDSVPSFPANQSFTGSTTYNEQGDLVVTGGNTEPETDPDTGHTVNDNNVTDVTTTILSGGGDDDNDVPALMEIKSTLQNLERTVVYQTNEMRGYAEVDGSLKQIQLADLYQAPQDQDAQEGFDQIDSAMSEGESVTNNVGDKFKASGVSVPRSGQDAPTLIEMGAGSYNFYLDPFNNTVSHGSILADMDISWSELSKWISLILGFVVGVYWFMACNRAVWDMLTDLIRAPMSAPTTSLTILGNSVGTLVLKSIKTLAILSLFGTAGVIGILVILESGFSLSMPFGDVISATSIEELSTQVANSAGTIHPGLNLGTRLFLDLVPIGSIALMAVSYFTLVYKAKLTITYFTLGLKAKS